MSRRLVMTFKSESILAGVHERVAKVYRDAEWNEHRVEHYLRGVKQAEASYHTDSLTEAKAHAQRWALEAPAQQVGTDWEAIAAQHARQRDAAMAQRDALQVRVEALQKALGETVAASMFVTGKDYTGALCMLVTKAGKPVMLGDELETQRGYRFKVVGGTAPRHGASTGHVDTDKGSYYPSVVDCNWVRA